MKRGNHVQYQQNAVGETIRRLRMEKNMPQELLSGLAGIARTHLSMIETGRKQASFETIWRLALALGLRPSEPGGISISPLHPSGLPYPLETTRTAVLDLGLYDQLFMLPLGPGSQPWSSGEGDGRSRRVWGGHRNPPRPFWPQRSAFP